MQSKAMISSRLHQPFQLWGPMQSPTRKYILDLCFSNAETMPAENIAAENMRLMHKVVGVENY